MQYSLKIPGAGLKGRGISPVCHARSVLPGPIVMLMFALLLRGAAAQDRMLDAVTDCAQTASRVWKPCQPKKTEINSRSETTLTIEIPALTTVHCATTSSLEYSQRNTFARVEGLIENRECAASEGKYTLAVIISDENHELRTLSFSGSWQRNDDKPVKLKADYEIGRNVELVRVKYIESHCTCTDTQEKETPGSE